MARQKKPEFEKTRSLRLRFGFRLNSIFWPLDVPAITQILDKLGYKDINTDSVGSLRATKASSDYYSDNSRMVFGFYANTIDALITAQREFFASAQKDFRANLHKFIRFYEIENILAYYLESSPSNEVSSIFSDSSDMGEISNIMGEDVSLSKLEVAKSDAEIQNDDWFNVEISPKVESATNAYHCRLIKRAKNGEEVIKTLRKSSEILEKMAAFVEQKNLNN